jgi:hypothetical protein
MLPPLASKPLVVGLLASFLAAFTTPATADLYEWTDADGRTHYSNSPRPGAKPVGLAPISLEEEGSPEDTASDEARRERRRRQRAERLIDNDEHAPAHGMIEAPAAPVSPLAPAGVTERPAETEPAQPDLRGERPVAPMPIE